MCDLALRDVTGQVLKVGNGDVLVLRAAEGVELDAVRRTAEALRGRLEDMGVRDCLVVVALPPMDIEVVDPESFYVEEHALETWERVAEAHVAEQNITGTLARALSTLIDAYRHAADG